MRLIDADALLAQMTQRKWYVGRPSDPVCLVEDAPTVDAVLVKHGTWVNKGVDFAHSYYDEWLYEWKCSECGKGSVMSANYPKSPYCWMCGANMDGERREE